MIAIMRANPRSTGTTDTSVRAGLAMSIISIEPAIIVIAVTAWHMHSASWVRIVSVSLVNLLITSPVFMRSRTRRGMRNILDARSLRMACPLRSEAQGTM